MTTPLPDPSWGGPPYVACANSECAMYQVACSNPSGLPLDSEQFGPLLCGTCWQPCVAAEGVPR